MANYKLEIVRGGWYNSVEMSKPKLERNKKLVQLRDKDPKKYSFSKLAELFNISRVWAYAIYMREKEDVKGR